MALQLQVQRLGDVVLVRCSGRLVGGESESLQQEIKKLMVSQRDFVLHLGEVNFIDSSGLGALVRLAGICRAARGNLKLCNVRPQIAQTLRVTNLHRLLEMHESEVEAVAAYYGKAAARDGTAVAGARVLCIDASEDVLAYLRELLRHAGYAPVTTSNPFDARILLKATRPALVILGPNAPAGQNLSDALAGFSTLGLTRDFSSAEAGQAAEDFLAQVRGKLQAGAASA